MDHAEAIADLRDVQRIGRAPYDAFMPHAHVLQALEDFNAGRFGSLPPNALTPHRAR